MLDVLKSPTMAKSSQNTDGSSNAPRRSVGRPSQGGRTPATIIHARIRPHIGAALEDFIAKSRPQTSIKAVVEAALEDFLISAGFLPARND